MKKGMLSFNIFCLSLMILLGSLVLHHFDHSTIAINSEMSSEIKEPSREGEGFHFLPTPIHFEARKIVALEFKSKSLHFIDLSSKEILLLTQLLSSNRIALPPPALV